MSRIKSRALRRAARILPGLAAALGATAFLAGQTRVDLRSQSKSVDFSAIDSTKPFKIGTSLPALCQKGEAFLKDEAGGQNLYICQGNQWLQVSVATTVSAAAPPSSCARPGVYIRSDSVTGKYQLYLCSSSAGEAGVWREAGVSGFNGRSGAVAPQAGDYTAAQVTNAVDQSGAYANPPWITSLAWGKITGAPALDAGANGSVSLRLGANTGAAEGLSVADTAGNSGSGVLAHFSTGAGSAMTPWQADANGAGWQVDASGALQSMGSSNSGSLTLSGSIAGSCTLTVPANGGAMTPGGAAECDLGSAARPIGSLFLAGASASPDTNNFRLTGTATAPRIWSLPDASDTFVGRATADVLTNKTFDTAGAANVFKINGTALTAVQGNSGTALLAGTVSGIGATLCADANGNATTTGCVSGGGGGLGDPGSNGLIRRTALNTTAPAVAGVDYAAANASTSVNGQTCSLGGSCTIQDNTKLPAAGGTLGGNLIVGGTVLQSAGANAISTDQSTPSTPAAGKTSIYTRGGKLCSLDPGGNENCTGGSGAGIAPFSCSVSAAASVVCNDNLGTTIKWPVCYDAGGNMLGGTTSSTALTNVVTTSNTTTITFSGSTTATCAISTGSMGPQGATGPTGANGASVTATAEANGANCAYGGWQLVSASGSSYVCNGAPGAPGSGNATIVAGGSATLGTSAIGSGACASAVTATATGVLATDAVTTSFNADPTGVAGYLPATSGMLTIIPYPTANAVNFKVCNLTAASITPGAITVNWRVVR